VTFIPGVGDKATERIQFEKGTKFSPCARYINVPVPTTHLSSGMVSSISGKIPPPLPDLLTYKNTCSRYILDNVQDQSVKRVP
jgi:hypothetical protein